MCRADRAGTVRYREGMRFYVTAARVADLGRWQRGEWIPSRIVEQGITFPQARRLVAQLNENSGGADAEQFYFLTSDRPLHL